jgi:DNA recombination protein RmuC
MPIIIILLVVILIVAVIALVVVLRRNPGAAGEQTVTALNQNAQDITNRFNSVASAQQQSDALLREEFTRSRAETQDALKGNREELAKSLGDFREAHAKEMQQVREAMNQQLTANRAEMDKQLTANRETTEKRLEALQKQNDAKLEQMRQTVDEKLTTTINESFAEKFKLIGDQLEAVQKGLGEMQALAHDVGDLNKVLAGVKTRGNLGEYQLGAILEQVLAPGQYREQAQVRKRSQERVDFAVVLPGKDDDGEELLLPIDSKFPLDDYERLLDAYDAADTQAIASLRQALAQRILTFARSIRDKYVNPPMTTDFAIMFIPTEGLYSEILRDPDLFERLQSECKVTPVGPANLVAFLSSLRMGFQTLAIQKQSSQIRKILIGVRKDFGAFGDLIDGVRKNLQAASNKLDNLDKKSNRITRNLDKVQELPGDEEELPALPGE